MIFSIIGVVPNVDVHAEEIWDGTADIEWYDSELTEMHIDTAEELAGLATLVNSGKTMAGQTIILDSDIMLNDISDYTNWDNKAPSNKWIPIGDTLSNYFGGIFDGSGHTIKGMYYRSTSAGDDLYLGLFGCIKSGAIIKNVLVDNSYFRGSCKYTSDYAYVGGIGGYNFG